MARLDGENDGDALHAELLRVRHAAYRGARSKGPRTMNRKKWIVLVAAGGLTASFVALAMLAGEEPSLGSVPSGPPPAATPEATTTHPTAPIAQVPPTPSRAQPAPLEQRTPVDDPLPTISSLPAETQRAFARINQFLQSADLEPIPLTKRISPANADYVVATVADLDQRLHDAHGALMKVMEEYGKTATDEIRRCLAEGRMVPYPTQDASPGKKRGEVMSTFTPAYSTTTYVIRPPPALVQVPQEQWLAVTAEQVRFAKEDVRSLVLD